MRKENENRMGDCACVIGIKGYPLEMFYVRGQALFSNHGVRIKKSEIPALTEGVEGMSHAMFLTPTV
jgi:hypothetical protein